LGKGKSYDRGNIKWIWKNGIEDRTGIGIRGIVYPGAKGINLSLNSNIIDAYIPPVFLNGYLIYAIF